MKFEVIGSDGKVKMYAGDRQCIPPASPVQALRRAGRGRQAVQANT